MELSCRVFLVSYPSSRQQRTVEPEPANSAMLRSVKPSWGQRRGDELILDSLMEGFTGLYFGVSRMEWFLQHPSFSTTSNFTLLTSQASEVLMHDRVQKPHINLNRHQIWLRVSLDWLWWRQNVLAGRSLHYRGVSSCRMQTICGFTSLHKSAWSKVSLPSEMR